MKTIDEIIKTIDVSEREFLYQKFSNALHVENESSVKTHIDAYKEQQYLASYKLNFIDLVIYYFHRFFFNEDYQTFVFKHELSNIKKHLSAINPHVIDKSGKMLKKDFFLLIEKIFSFKIKYQAFYQFILTLIELKESNFDILKVWLNRFGNDKLKSQIKYFDPDAVQKIINNTANYRKYLNEILNSMKTELHHYSQQLDEFFDFIYNFVKFMQFEHELFLKYSYPIDYVPGKGFLENPQDDVHLESVKHYIPILYKLFTLYPFLDNIDNDMLNFILELFQKKTGVKDDSIRDDLDEINKFVFFINSKRIFELLYKITTNNPLNEIESFRLSLLFSKKLDSFLSTKLDLLISEEENTIRQKKAEQIRESFKKENIKTTEMKDLNLGFNAFLANYGLIPLHYLEILSYFLNFYSNIWVNKILPIIEHILDFKFYIFPMDKVRALKSEIENFSKFLNEAENLERDCHIIKMDLLKEKFTNISDDRKARIEILITKLDLRIKEVLKKYLFYLLKVKVHIEYNKNDDEVLKLLELINRYISMFRFIME